MKYFDALSNLGCFKFNDVLNISENENTANSMLQYYKKCGALQQVRKGLYATVNPVDKELLTDKFQIASKITDTATVSHHSAFEYYGYANQVSYQVFISSETKFNSFMFNGDTYTRMPMNIKSGIVITADGVNVTDVERTVIDSISDFEKSMGFEELIQCISLIPILNENKLLKYLDEYNKCFLYQKVGFILEHFKDNFDLTEDFFEICKEKSGKSSRYLLKDMPKVRLYTNNRWRLTMPLNLWKNIEGGDLNADI